jgi:hypothetical protein
MPFFLLLPAVTALGYAVYKVATRPPPPKPRLITKAQEDAARAAERALPAVASEGLPEHPRAAVREFSERLSAVLAATRVDTKHEDTWTKAQNVNQMMEETVDILSQERRQEAAHLLAQFRAEAWHDYMRIMQ